MSKYHLKWVLGGIMIVALAFTTDYLLKQVRLVVNSKFGFSGVRINKISLKSIDLTLFFFIVNPSDISVKVKNQTYDIFLDGEFVKTVGNENEVKIKAHADTRIPVLVSISPKDAIKIAASKWAALTTKEGRSKTVLEVKGKMSVSTEIATIRQIPFEFKDDIESIMNY